MRAACTPASATAAILLALASAAFPPPALAQQPVRLTEPDASFPEDFGSIQTVRELPDGRVLVADPLGRALFAVDLDAGVRSIVGREGGGPGEYRQPDAVWPLPGDSTLLVDLGNSRLSALGPGLAFGSEHPITVGDPEPGRPLVLAIPQGVDGEGRLYVRALGGRAPGSEPPDSAPILRVDRDAGEAAPVARFKIREVRTSGSGGPGARNVAMSPVPLSPEDAWGVADDGSVAIARSGDYHLEWIRPDGSVVRGEPVRYDPVRIGTAEKEEYLSEQDRSGGGVAVRMQNRNGEMTMSFQRGGGPPRREIDAYDWPERKPPFYDGRIPIDASGRAWVRRHVAAGEPATYDVFDDAARRIATVILAPERRVIGFGAAGVYVVAYDDFDLNYLERYPAPAF